MVNMLWLIMIVTGIAFALASGRVAELAPAIFSSAELAVELIIGLVGVMGFWLGLAKLIQRSGLLQGFIRLLRPVVRALFPSVPANHPATGVILMNITANLLGLGNAATPFGLRAMHYLQELNPRPKEASDAMCTFMALNTACITLVPTMVIAIRTAQGSRAPGEIIGTTLVSTLVATTVAVILDYFFRRLRGRR
ncbi:MAG: spore maturation protein [Firmicutes bacterium]|nr:spore maturation protein [Bacillota bacterium]